MSLARAVHRTLTGESGWVGVWVRGGSNRLLSAEEVAEMFGVSVDTVYRRWRQWGLTGYREGKALRFRDRDVENWLETHKA